MQTSVRFDHPPVPLVPITAPHIGTPRISRPALPKRGCREYLRQMRKLREIELSAAGIGNRAARRAHARTLRFA